MTSPFILGKYILILFGSFWEINWSLNFAGNFYFLTKVGWIVSGSNLHQSINHCLLFTAPSLGNINIKMSNTFDSYLSLPYLHPARLLFIFFRIGWVWCIQVDFKFRNQISFRPPLYFQFLKEGVMKSNKGWLIIVVSLLKNCLSGLTVQLQQWIRLVDVRRISLSNSIN